MAVAESLAFGVFVLSVIKFLQYLKWVFKVKKMLAKMDGPKTLPVLGITLGIFNSESILNYFLKKFDGYGSPAKVWFGPSYLIIYVEDPKTAKTVLLAEETLDKANFYKLFRLENTIFANDRLIWKSQRRMLNAMRNKNRVVFHHPTVEKRAERLVNVLKRLDGAPEFDVFNYIGAYILEVVFEAGFNVDFNALDDPDNNEILHKIEMTNAIIFKRMSIVWYHVEFIYRFSKLYKEELKYSLESYFERLITENFDHWKEYFDKTKSYGLGIIEMIRPEHNFTHEELRDGLKGFIFAAFDTTSSVLSSLLVLLGMHLDVQKKLFDEITDTIKSTEGKLDFQTIQKMSYVDQVFKETMRLFPAAPLIGRYSQSDLKLDEQQTIPAGTNILINMYNLHRNPKYWGDDAHLFIPERFEPERIKNVDPNAYIPFSLGPRNCIGFLNASDMFKTALVFIVKSYHVSTSLKFENIRTDHKITLKFSEGYKIGLRNRK